jgi:hypothetical protein
MLIACQDTWCDRRVPQRVGKVAAIRIRTSLDVAVVVLVVSIPTVGIAGMIPNGRGPLAHYSVQKQPTAGSCRYRTTSARQPLPDRRCTPGARNPKVTPATLGSTICRSGYTASIRPPSSVTRLEKRANAASYRYAGRLSQAEYDHLIPLELGGDPNDRRNLWVEPPSPGHRKSQTFHNPKDSIENKARSLVCRRRVALGAMQRAIAANWTTALAAVGHPTGR